MTGSGLDHAPFMRYLWAKYRTLYSLVRDAMNATDSVLDMFLELAAISSPPGHEREVADRVHGFLHQLGLETDEDRGRRARSARRSGTSCAACRPPLPARPSS